MGILDTAIGVALGVIIAEATFRVLRFVLSFIYVYKHRDEMAKAKREYAGAVAKAANKAAARTHSNVGDDWASGGYR